MQRAPPMHTASCLTISRRRQRHWRRCFWQTMKRKRQKAEWEWSLARVCSQRLGSG